MRAEVKMDAKRLIAEVYKRPALWNQKHVSYHNRDVTNRVWMEIASLFKLPKQILKSKWKGLRDTFRAELKKEQSYRKTKFGLNRPVWKHFKTLHFLKEQMLPRPPIWERASCDAANSNVAAATCGASAARDSGASSKPPVRPVLRRRFASNATAAGIIDATDSPTKNKPRNVNKHSRGTEHENNRETSRENVMTLLMDFDAVDTVADHVADDALHLTKDLGDKRPENVVSVKIEPTEHRDDHQLTESNLEHRENPIVAEIISNETPHDFNDLRCTNPLDTPAHDRYDDNYYFFVSLLPHIKSLPAERRMFLRMRMQQLVYEEVYNKSAALSSSSDRVVPRTNSTPRSASPLRDK